MTSPAPVECRIRRSGRAKRLRLVVRPSLIELVVPAGMAEAQALRFLSQHREWAENKARDFHGKLHSQPVLRAFCELPSLPWRGTETPLRIIEDDCRRVSVKVDQSVQITLPKDLGENRDRAAKRALYQWMSRWLTQRIKDLAQRHGSALRVAVRQIRVKSMKTRWGSCGPRNDINVNWLLALAPDTVLEYVVVHELCHIRERNHSPEFWALVAQHCAEYPRHRQWLKEHGAVLMQRFSVDS